MENIKILCDRQDIVFIADAVRNKTGSSQELTLGDIAASINGIETGGGNVIATHDGNGNVTLMNVNASNDGGGNIILE